MGTPQQARACTVDRSAEADRVIEYLLEGRKRLAVLYGRRGSRRRELVRDWVIPRTLGREMDAYYGECEPDLPPTVRGVRDELPVVEALQRGGLVFLGRMERHLSVPDREKQRQLAELLGGVERGECRGSIVLLLPKRDLAQLLAFQPVAPSLMTNMLEIEVVTFRDSLRWMGQGAPGLEYAPEAIEALAAEVEGKSDGDGVELAWAVDRGFARFKLDAGGVVTLADCGFIGGVSGALEWYREEQVGKAAERWGVEGRKAVETILEEVASALGEGVPPELDDLPLRLGIEEARFNEILQWLSGDGQLLRDDGNRRLEIVPAELRPAIEAKMERNRRDVMRASGLLREGLRSWNQLGAGLPRKRLEEIDAVREALRAGEEEAALMVRSLLRIEGTQDLATIGYWLRRVRSPQREVSLSIEAVFAERAEVRLRAVQLLRGFDEPDVRRQLHRAAIEDPDRDVRRAALASLRDMHLEELWPLVSQEVGETGSPYQENAVAALRLFPNQASAALLRGLLGDAGQSSGVKAEAIETLAALATPEAVKMLVDIGLNDEDVEDRRRVGPALSSVDSRDRVREAMEAVRESPVKLEQSEPMTIRRAAGVVVRTVLSVVTAVSSWLALIALGRYTTGLFFLGTSVLLILLAILGRGRAELVALALFALNSVASLLAATRAAIVEERKRNGGGPGQDAKNTRRWSLGRPLTAALLAMDLVPCFFLHGLAHLLAGRVRRGVTLFALECLGILCLAAGWFYYGGSDPSAMVFSVEVSGFLMYLYVGVGLALFVGTFLWDVAAVANEVVFYTRRRNARERRAALYTAIAGNRWAAEYILQRAASGTRRDAWWARRLMLRTAQYMPLAELIASVKAQSRRPRYLLECLKQLKTREETVHTLASEWREATPRLRRWIVDVLAGKPTERSLEQLRDFRRDLDWYGRLRYAVGKWHHRVRLWPKMLIFVGILLLPMVVLAPFELYAIVKDPVRPLLRVVQNNDEEFVEMVHFLAKARPAKSVNTLMSLFRDPKASRSVAWRKGIAGSLGIAVCQEALHDEQRATLTAVLIEGLRKGRLEVVEGLLPIKQDAGRCGLSEGSRQELARAAADLLKGASAAEQAQLAILGLDAARHTRSVAPLRVFVLQLTQPKNQEKNDPGRAVAQWDELRRAALLALSSNGSETAVAALKEIAKANVPAALRAEAERLAQQSAQESLLAAVKQSLDRGEYERAHNQGLELLHNNPPGPLRFELLALAGEASYRLALAPGGYSTDWNSKAIGYFEEAQGIERLDANRRRMLAQSYAILAVHLKLDKNDPGGAFGAAGQALKEDPDYAGAYCVQAWLMQGNHQDAASLEYALKAIQKEPHLAWSYELAQDAYLKQAESAASPDVRRQKLTEATVQFEQLAQRYPDVMWPRRRLVHLYHEFVSEFDPERALARTYEIYTALEKQFESRLSETEKLDLDANFLESRFTTGHYQEVIEIGGQLDGRLPHSNYELRVPVNVLRYAALVMRGDAAGALVQLRQLESLVSGMPAGTKVGWIFNGSLRYLRAQQPQGNTRQRLIELFEAANLLKDGKGLSQTIIAANRSALQTAIAH
jgi:HEAT repeat protein